MGTADPRLPSFAKLLQRESRCAMVHNLIDRRDFISRAATAAASFASPGLIGGAATTLALAGTGARAQEPRRGGVMNIILQPEPAALVLALNITSQNQLVAPKMYSGLLTYGFDLKPLPNLATSWDISPDGLTYTFQLAQNAKWHDGGAVHRRRRDLHDTRHAPGGPCAGARQLLPSRQRRGARSAYRGLPAEDTVSRFHLRLRDVERADDAEAHLRRQRLPQQPGERAADRDWSLPLQGMAARLDHPDGAQSGLLQARAALSRRYQLRRHPRRRAAPHCAGIGPGPSRLVERHRIQRPPAAAQSPANPDRDARLRVPRSAHVAEKEQHAKADGRQALPPGRHVCPRPRVHPRQDIQRLRSRADRPDQLGGQFLRRECQALRARPQEV